MSNSKQFRGSGFASHNAEPKPVDSWTPPPEKTQWSNDGLGPVRWYRWSKEPRFTLYQLACLINGVDPSLVERRLSERARDGSGPGEPLATDPDAFAQAMFYAPHMFLGDILGETFYQLREGKAGATFRGGIEASEAKELVEATGYKWPDELETAAQSQDGDNRISATNPAPPVTAESVSSPPGQGKVWTPERLSEMKAYRERHGTKKTAEFYKVSAQRVRELLPSDKPKAKGYSAFNRPLK
ncbi:MAG: hypothetical protein Q8S02_08710 [Hydrogenophaga sp.]|nr:hypothetical protein [Hydrogenophaga sp.]